MNIFLKLIKKNMESLRVKLFLTLSLTILIAITIFILFNNIVLESYLIYEQENVLIDIYKELDEYYLAPDQNQYKIDDLEKAAIKENMDILVIGNSNDIIYSTSDQLAKEYYNKQISSEDNDLLLQSSDYKIYSDIDSRTDITDLVIAGKLSNGFKMFCRVPINGIQETVEIINKFCYLIGVITIIISIVIIVFLTNLISKPIIELRLITKKMKDLDFSQRFKERAIKDEIGLLGKNINVMADSLEFSIEELKAKNTNLVKDIEEKTKIDEMRTTFISDVSHELKTPIAIIQGYAEGILNGIADDSESQRYYTEVILDEANKMDRLVKSLLELMKLEYGKRQFKNKKFNLVAMEDNVINNTKTLFDRKDIEIIFKPSASDKEIEVYADDFYIEQVFQNYLTNALKYATPKDGKTFVKIYNKVFDSGKKVRVFVENTGTGLSEEEMQKIWTRFYKIDKSRHRSANSSGIGLSLVKAVINNYGNKYGAQNTNIGIRFYFDLDIYSQDNMDRIKMLDEPVENLKLKSNELNKITSKEIEESNKLIDDITNTIDQKKKNPHEEKKLKNAVVPKPDEIEKRQKELKQKLEQKIYKEPFDEDEYIRAFNKVAKKQKNKH